MIQGEESQSGQVQHMVVRMISSSPLPMANLYYHNLNCFCVMGNGNFVFHLQLRPFRIVCAGLDKRVVPRLRELAPHGQMESGDGIHAT